MSKFTDAVAATLRGYFNAGDQPTEAQFTELITKIQEGIEEHDHDATGDGDGIAALGPLTSLEMAEDAWIGIGAALERLVFNGGDDAIAVMGASLGVGILTPAMKLDIRGAGAATTLRVGYNTAASVRIDLQAAAAQTYIVSYNDATSVYVQLELQGNPVYITQGSLKVANLAGVGTRNVSADANGNLVIA